MKKDLLVLGALFATAAALVVASRFLPTAQFQTTTFQPAAKIVQINNLKIAAEVVDTPDKRSKGLSERDGLAADSGMLFIFEKDDHYSFWMKNVKFPIDIIFITANRRVAQIFQNVPPEPGVNDSKLTIYKPDQPVRYVLEVAAGSSQRASIKTGDQVLF